jgi:capsular polysaccharide biosynthesis protein
MNDPQHSVAERQNGFRDLFAYDDSSDFDDLPSATDASVGLVSIGYIGSALRRGVLVWLGLAVIGLVAGLGLAVEHTPAHAASTTVLLEVPASSTQGTVIATDAAIAQSTPVAAAVVAQLGIQQTPASFLQTYTVTTQLTTTILTITAKGPNDDAAVQRAAAIATQFLAFQAKYLKAQLNQTTDSLNQQVSQAQQHLSSIEKQIGQVSAQPSSSSQAAQLSALQTQQTAAENTLNSVKQNAAYTQSAAQVTTAQVVRGSEVLSSATPNHRSVKKTLVLYTVGALVGGLVIGMSIVVISAITTDRLRRRDDIAIAVGAPVKLSVGPLRRRRWRKKSGRRNRDMERVVAHLRDAVPAHPKGAAGFAVVAADDASTVARAAIKLAIAHSQQRRRVVLVDLSAGAPAARRLGITGPGIGTVSPEGVPIVVVVPDAEDVAPLGPLGNRPAGSAQMMQGLAEACAEVDLILSVVTLNPAFDSDYLRTWATDAVMVVTAGQSTATRLNAVGEMIRLAGTRLASVVVLNAERSDESLGTVTADYQPAATV